MSEVRLNKNICIIETHMKVGQIIDTLSKKQQYAYIVLRHPKSEANKFWFYVCRPKQLLYWIKYPRSFPYLPDDLEKASLTVLIDKKNDSINNNLSLIKLLPFHETDSAPVVSATISSIKDELLYQGMWKSTNFPVLLQGKKPQGIFEPVPAQGNKFIFKRMKLQRYSFGNISPYIGAAILSYHADDFEDLFDERKSGDTGGSVSAADNESFARTAAADDEDTGGTVSAADNETHPISDTPIHQAYPDIQASNEHPVVGESIDLEVTLKDVPSSTTGGTVILPNESTEFVYNMRVHLLCGDTSEWQDDLKYSQAKGTIESAKFKITAPDLTLDANGDYPEREKLLVRANFYYKNRWCGEARRFLDLRLEETVPALKKIPKPPVSEWQKCINIEQGTQPADLLVRIQHQQGNKYLWSFLSPHFEFTGNSDSSMEIPNGAETWVRDLFSPFVGIELSTSQQNNIEGIGESIYEITPKAFKEAYWQLFNAAKENSKISFNSILFISDESSVPWELMRLADLQRDEEIKPEFLGIRHAVGRWIASESSRLKQNITIRVFVSTGSDYAKVERINKLPWVKKELEWLKNRYDSEIIPLKFDPVNRLLEKGKAQAVHFACHGKKSDENAPLNELITEDYPVNIGPFAIARREVQKGLGDQHPMIFLNACEAGATENKLGLIVGLPSAFLKAGASAVISPLWAIGDEHAQEITKQFYKAAFTQDGATLGEILKDVRKKWISEHHLTFLAYVLYGDPQARITFKPHPRIRETAMEQKIKLSTKTKINKLKSGITLLAPGLSGSCRYVGARTHGDTTRAFTAEQTGLDKAIDEANLEDRHTLVIEAPTPEPQNNQGGRGDVFQDAVRNNEILLQVPGYVDERQFLMYTDEAGIISFHYPEPIETNQALPSTRSIEAAVQNQYRITLRNAQVQNTDISAPDTRGLFGKIGSKILKVLVTKVFKEQTGNAVHWAIEQWENRCRKFQGLHGGKDFSELMNDSPVPFDKWDDIHDKKALLFIHGTSSSTAGAFEGLLKSDIPERLYKQYEGRVLAFNHHTMSVGVADNVKQFYDAFKGHPGSYTFDIICHSRGGLVARALNHLPDEFIAKQLNDWQRPTDVIINIDRIVFVATPNAGTDLALPNNLSAMIERLANFINQFPDGLTSISGGMLLTLASAIVDAGLPYIPGLEDQSPESKLISALTDDSNQAANYYGFGANYEVKGSLRTVVKAGVDSAVDRLFNDKTNDLVVPTLGVSKNSNFCLDSSHTHNFEGSTVHHTNFFSQPEIEEILKILA